MNFFTRINSMGLTYHFTRKNDKQTSVVCNRKSIILDMPLEEIAQCYYNWQMRGMHIQNAFPNMPAEQREFLLTSITPTEWNEIFKDKSYSTDLWNLCIGNE
jgi:hypothetical protein